MKFKNDIDQDVPRIEFFCVESLSGGYFDLTLQSMVSNKTVVISNDLWRANAGFPFACKRVIVVGPSINKAKMDALTFVMFHELLGEILNEQGAIFVGDTFFLQKLVTSTSFPQLKPDKVLHIGKNLVLDKNYKLIGFSTENKGKRLLHYKYKCEHRSSESGYLRLLADILAHGHARPDRTGTGTIGVFGRQLRFDLKQGVVPLLTTKRVAWKSCIKELLWFLRGDTDAKILQKQDVHIWDGNTSRSFLDGVGLEEYPEGVLGAGYGWQWRFFGAPYSPEFADTSRIVDRGVVGGFDQIEYIIHELKHNKHSRRIMLSAWNPADFDKVALPPCHFSCQFYVQGNELSCHMTMRSADVFLGLPFNIFSYSVLTRILAAKTELVPGELVISIGDAHIYKNHVAQVQEQLRRPCRPLPHLLLSEETKSKPIEDLDLADFELVGYFPHPKIVAEMSA
jgi:thymidylate synthase